MDMNLSSFKKFAHRSNLLPLIISFFFFFLQVRFLRLAAFPDSDEGVYAEAGRFIAHGFVPHRDFPLFHMPLLPILIGIGLKLLSGMYQLRVIFLLLNCLAAVPLYITLRRIQDNAGAALLAILFYLTYHDMVHHDFRFLAIRQLANDLFICFFYLGVVQKNWKYTPLFQSSLSIGSVFLFLPAAFNLLFVSLAIILSESNGKVRISLLKHYVYIALITILTLLMYFILIPNSFSQIVVDQLNRGSMGWLERLGQIVHSRFYQYDRFFYAFSFIFLILSVFMNRQLRFYSLAMIGIVLVALFLPSYFFAHYLSAAGPAFAFGIFAFGILIFGLLRCFDVFGLIVVYSSYILLFSIQLSIVSSSLLDEWLGNKDSDYAEIISVLSRSSEPLITVKPIFAVEAHKELLPELADAYMRSPIGRSFTAQEYHDFAERACTIFLDSDAAEQLPNDIIERWSAEYSAIYENKWGKILVTRKQHCNQQK